VRGYQLGHFLPDLPCELVIKGIGIFAGQLLFPVPDPLLKLNRQEASLSGRPAEQPAGDHLILDFNQTTLLIYLSLIKCSTLACEHPLFLPPQI
jgi:hypothetical protein